jgi:hypothetical protein
MRAYLGAACTGLHLRAAGYERRGFRGRRMIARRNKYGAKRATDGARWYASTAERDRAVELRQMEAVGLISALALQVPIRLAGSVTYRADFVYQEDGRLIVEDVKGVVTERFAVVCQLWPLWGEGVLRITARGGRRRGFMVRREILPQPLRRRAVCETLLEMGQ